jgi:hypothetical protein
MIPRRSIYGHDDRILCSRASQIQALKKQNDLVAPTFHKLLIESLWDDGLSESLTLLNKNFTMALAGMSAREFKLAALDWATTFPYQEPLQQTPAYTSLPTREGGFTGTREGSPAAFSYCVSIC